MKSLIFSLTLSLLCVACANLGRSRDSGYGNSNPKLHLHRSSEDHSPEQADISTKTRLKQLENSMGTRKEVDQYSKALPWFKDDNERIEFLSLPGFEAKQKWIMNHDFNTRSAEIQSQMTPLVESQDIAVGMPQALVRKAWGDPETVEVSGNPQFKNERWKYSKFVSSSEGYNPQKKIVYFEGGKVVGWEVE